MVDKDYGGEGAIKKAGRNWQRILLPVVGLVMIIAAGAIAFLLSRPAGVLLRSRIAPGADMQSIQLAAGIGIFLVIIMVFGALYAAIVPKPPKGISEGELDKEKKERFEEAQRAKRRKREMKNKMRDSRNKPQ